MFVILALLLQFYPWTPLPQPDTPALPTSPPAPVETCTASGLGLSTKVLTENAAFELAASKWGAMNVRQWKRGSTVMLGVRMPLFGLWMEPNPTKCPFTNCWRNTNGSWRSLWNSIAIQECQRRQP